MYPIVKITKIAMLPIFCMFLAASVSGLSAAEKTKANSDDRDGGKLKADRTTKKIEKVYVEKLKLDQGRDEKYDEEAHKKRRAAKIKLLRASVEED